MSKALARGNKKSVVDDCFSDTKTLKFLKRKLSSVLKKEYVPIKCSQFCVGQQPVKISKNLSGVN